MLSMFKLKNSLWMIVLVAFFIPIVAGFTCSPKIESNQSNYRSPRANQQESVVGFKMPDTPTNKSIDGTLADVYLGAWIFNKNCGNNHGGKGNHNINGVMKIKDNNQFELLFITTKISNNIITYKLKREGYWTLSKDGSFIDMAVVHELNSRMEIIVTDPKASLKLYFKIWHNDPTKGYYMDEKHRKYEFSKLDSKTGRFE